MAIPQVEVLGVYRLPITEELIQEQFGILYDYPMSKRERAQAELQCRQQLSSVVLVEAIIRNRDHGFDVGHFTQPEHGIPENNWQVAWAESYLTLDGKSLAFERWSDPPESGDLRVAFFMHFWQSDKPLRSSYGDVTCPQVTEMPERLARLVPYQPVD
jgi:hypothetical protein